MPEIFGWKRFLCKRDGLINLSDRGYLYDPESHWGAHFNPNVVTYEKVSSIPCVIVLGEPGSGKSIALEQFANEHRDSSFKLNLNICSSDAILYRRLFESPQFAAWKNGDAPLHLFLDSLDECLPRIGGLVGLLAAEFRDLPLDRLFIRIACRTAEWTKGFENEFKQIWDEKLQVLEITPLRRVDVKDAATAFGVDAESFMEAIEVRGIQSLAIKPITLKMLLEMYRSSETITGSVTDLYLAACERLCEAQSASGSHNNPDLRERIQIASRIAALTVFCGKNAIWVGTHATDRNVGDLSIQEISFGSDEDLPSDFIMREQSIRQVLGSGLFSSRGPDRIGFAHQTYLEFLAARYIKELSLTKVLSLVVHPQSINSRITPQLREVVAWLSTMRGDVRADILKRDPQILLRADTVTFSHDETEQIVEGLLKEYMEGRVVNPSFDLISSFTKLNHPGLAEQLRPFIVDPSQDADVRQAALRMAQACQLNSLQSEIVHVALDDNEIELLRVNAGYAIRDCADTECKQRLKPLIELELQQDPHDELKGIGLQILYPSIISTEEVFKRLSLPQRQSFTGAYKYFLNYTLLDDIPISDLPIALKWCELHSLGQGMHPFEDLVRDILIRAWQHFHLPQIQNALANAVWQIIRDHFTVQFLLAHDDDRSKTHALITKMIKQFVKTEDDVLNLRHTGLLRPEDFSWLIASLASATEPVEKTAWATLIQYECNWTPLQTELLFEAVQKCPELADRCKAYFEAIELGSEKAQQMQLRYRNYEIRPLIQKPVFVHTLDDVQKILNDYDSGNFDAWIHLHNYLATQIEHQVRYLHTYVTDLTQLPGWDVVDEHTRIRIIEIAKHYIRHEDPNTEEWFDLGQMPPKASAAYRSMRLILHSDQSIVEIFEQHQLWQKWAPVVVYCTRFGEEEPDLEQILALIYQNASITVIAFLKRLITVENERSESLYFLRKFVGIWEEPITNSLLPLLNELTLKPIVNGELLKYLLKQSLELSSPVAMDLIRNRDNENPISDQTAVIAANELMVLSTDGWNFVFGQCQTDIEFGKKVFLRLAASYFPNFKLPDIDEETRAESYIWLQKHFPYEEDVEHDNVYSPSPRDHAGLLRDSLLRGLVIAGTNESYHQVKRIAQQLIKYRWMRQQLAEAEMHTLEDQWIPIMPGLLLKLLYLPQLRLVQNGDHLLDILMNMLSEIQHELHGETPAVVDLWDEVESDKFKPISENQFSDWVVRRLRELFYTRGVVANREVVIRDRVGDAPGERTDILVQAVSEGDSQNQYNIITVVIEAKCNWNDELMTAMQRQLFQRYLTGTRFHHGIYLVGWFTSSKWINSDYKKPIVLRLDRSNVIQQLELQASQLSSQGATIKLFMMDTSL